MSTTNAPRKVTKHELREDQVVTLYARLVGSYHRNKKIAFALGGALLAIALLVVGYYFYHRNQEQKAAQLLGHAEALYEQGDYRAALDGTDKQPGLLKIADGYGSTDAGNLATFYAADALFRLGEYDQALKYFKAYDKTESFIGASAIAGEAAVYENKKDFARAGQLYKEAALQYENELTSPQYLLSAGRAFEHAKRYDDARDAYETLREKFKEAPAAEAVDFYLARVDAQENGAS